MTDVVVFHHAQGLTDGVRAFAQTLADAGHTVTVPDLFDGATFTTVADGVAHAEELTFDTVLARGHAAVQQLPEALVYLGFSLGVLCAQSLAQTRPGALGALLLHGCVPVTEFSASWPDGVPVQVHSMESDPYFVSDGDLEAARELVETTAGAELFLYPGDGHLFADSSVADYEPVAAALLTERVLAFLAQR
jgi:dienelactone hydrolase